MNHLRLHPKPRHSRHIILILSQPIFSSSCCMLSREQSNTNFIIFGVTQPELEMGITPTKQSPTIKHATQWGSRYSIFSFMCVFCRSLFVLLYFFFWPLFCLFFFDVRILITPLVSSNSLLTCMNYSFQQQVTTVSVAKLFICQPRYTYF